VILFTVPGIPVAKARPRFFRAGAGVRTFTPATSARFEERVRLCAQQAGVRIVNEGPVELRVVAYWPMTGAPLKRGARPGRLKTSRPDIDNVLKAIADALNGIAYKDDGQVALVSIEKRHCSQEDGEGARVVVHVGPVDDGVARPRDGFVF
jgi:Holliday junction resolvase RusA-like endonuclease